MLSARFYVLYWLGEVLEIKVRVYESVTDFGSFENRLHVCCTTGSAPSCFVIQLLLVELELDIAEDRRIECACDRVAVVVWTVVLVDAETLDGVLIEVEVRAALFDCERSLFFNTSFNNLHPLSYSQLRRCPAILS